MFQVIICTLLMMLGAFIIGFAVAGLIKFVGFSLNYFEKFSISKEIVVFKRMNRIHKLRIAAFEQLFIKIQKDAKNDLMDYSFPFKSNSCEYFDLRKDNELIRYYYGKN